MSKQTQQRMGDNEYIPEKKAWLVFDLSNGHPRNRQYVWWFRSRQEARNHINRQIQIQHSAKLSSPQRWKKDV